MKDFRHWRVIEDCIKDNKISDWTKEMTNQSETITPETQEQARRACPSAEDNYFEAKKVYSKAKRVHLKAKRAFSEAKSFYMETHQGSIIAQQTYFEAKKVCAEAKQVCSVAKHAYSEAKEDYIIASLASEPADNDN